MRDIVVHSPGFQTWDSSVRYAAQLAASMHAALTGLYITPHNTPAPGPPLLVEEMTAYAQEELHRAMLAGRSFALWAGQFGVRDTRWQVAIGQPADALVLAGDWHDVVVLQGNNAAPGGAAERLICELMVSGVACIVVPDANVAPGRVVQAVVAWDRSTASSRALHSALPLLRAAQSVTLLQPPPDTAQGKSGTDALAYMRARGVPVAAVQILTGTDQAVGEQILGHAVDQRADLLVMGASGQRRLGERCLGPIVSSMLTHARAPLFLQH